MDFCLFQTALEDEITILNITGGDPAAVRMFQTGLRMLLPNVMRKECVMPPPTQADPPQLVEMRDILDALTREMREARPHEKQMARHGIALAAGQFSNDDYRESVYLWLAIQNYAEEKNELSQSSQPTDGGCFFP